MVDRYNSDLANNLGNLLARVATVVGKKCDGIGPAPSAGQPARGRRRRARTPTPPRRGQDVQPSLALEATWRLLRETNAYLEANEPWKAEPGPEVDAVLGDALEVLRIVAVLASPAMPGRPAPRSGAASASTARPRTSGCPSRRGLGRLPRRAAGREGRAAVPPHHGLSGPVRWTDDHCHLPTDPTRPPALVADAAGGRGRRG